MEDLVHLKLLLTSLGEGLSNTKPALIPPIWLPSRNNVFSCISWWSRYFPCGVPPYCRWSFPQKYLIWAMPDQHVGVQQDHPAVLVKLPFKASG